MKTLALAFVCVLALLGVLVWALRGDVTSPAPTAEPAVAPSTRGDVPASAAALEREPAATLPERAPAEVARADPPAAPLPLPELFGERAWTERGVQFFGANLAEVAHVFVLENRGAEPITFVGVRGVTTSTTVSNVEWPVVLARGQRLELELVNKLRVEQDEKTSRAELVTDTGAIVTLTLLACAAR